MFHPVLAGVEQRLTLRRGQGAQGVVRGVGELRELSAEVGGERFFAVALQEGLPIVPPKHRYTLWERA